LLSTRANADAGRAALRKYRRVKLSMPPRKRGAA
jgi:hypothetical protein